MPDVERTSWNQKRKPSVPEDWISAQASTMTRKRASVCSSVNVWSWAIAKGEVVSGRGLVWTLGAASL